MSGEHKIQNEIRNALAGECVLFRINSGKAWTGNDITRLPDGSLLIRDPRPFETGVPPGFSDTFGLVEITITPDMVGQVKTETGRVSPKQSAFLAAMSKRGALAGVWRSVQDALSMVRGAKKN